jgi:hypothetical protein
MKNGGGKVFKYKKILYFTQVIVLWNFLSMVAISKVILYPNPLETPWREHRHCSILSTSS